MSEGHLSAYAKWQLENLEKRETAAERAARVQGYQQSSLFRTHDREGTISDSNPRISSTTKDSYIRHAARGGGDPALTVTPDLELRKSHWAAGGGSYNPDPDEKWTTTSRSAQADLVAARAAGSVTRARPTQDPWASSSGSSLTEMDPANKTAGRMMSTSQAMYTIPDAKAREETLAWRKVAKQTNMKLQETSNWTASEGASQAGEGDHWESTTRAATKKSAEALRTGSKKDWTAQGDIQDPQKSSITGVFKMETAEEESKHFESLKKMDSLGTIPADYVADNVAKSKELKSDLQASHFKPCDYYGQTYQTESGAAYAAPPADLLTMSRSIAADRRSTKDLNTNPYATHIPGWRTQTMEDRAGRKGSVVDNDSLDDWDERRTVPSTTTSREAFVRHDASAGLHAEDAKAIAAIAADLRTSHIGTALGDKTSQTPLTTSQAAFNERGDEKPVSRADQQAVAAAYRAEYQGTHFKLDDGMGPEEELASRKASGYRAEFHGHDFSAARSKEASAIKEDLRRTHYVLGYSGRDGQAPTASRHDFRKYSNEEQAAVRGVSVKSGLWKSSAGTSALAYEDGIPSAKWVSDGHGSFRNFSSEEQTAGRGVSYAKSEENGKQALQKTHFRLGEMGASFETTSGAGYRAPKALVDDSKVVIRAKDAEPPKRAVVTRRSKVI